MARRFFLAAVVAALAVACPASAFAAAPATGLTLTSTPYAVPASMAWTPDPLNVPPGSQQAYRADIACPTQGPAPAGSPVGGPMAPDVQARDTGANLADGKYCFH
jgi:hypothetical protein